MLNFLKLSVPLSVGVGSAGIVGSNWVFKKEEPMLIDINHNEDWDKKVQKLFTKVKGNDGNLKTQIAGQGEHKDSLTIENNDSSANFKEPAKAREALKAWCQAKKDSNEDTVIELCKEKQWVGWLFRNQIK